MTIGGTTPGRKLFTNVNINREVSSSLVPEEEELDSPLLSKKSMKASGALNSSIARQVSHDGLLSISIMDQPTEIKASAASGPGSPVRCVSEFDKVANVHLNAAPGSDCDPVDHTLKSPRPPVESSIAPGRSSPCPNVLHNQKLYELHVQAVRLEAELHPMRLILSRLMNHTTLNRKGIFNCPVDPVALNLPDYHRVISRPMDFGTIKMKLHAIAYQSREEVDADIRLVLSNAMTYNPPMNAVHQAARALLIFYEEQCEAFVPDLVQSDKMADPMDLETSTNYSSFHVEPNGSAVDDANPIPTANHLLSVPGSSTDGTGVSCESSATIVHNHVASSTTRKSASISSISVCQPKKRRKRGSRTNVSHACDRCEGRTCSVCLQGCLMLEPTLLICNGVHCAGARIRKGASYFIAKDGSRQFCQRCHTSLPAVLPPTGHEDMVRYKRDLLKRKNDEEIAEQWLQCSMCDSPVHQMCVMHDEYLHQKEKYVCPGCVTGSFSAVSPSAAKHNSSWDDLYTFVSGAEAPVRLSLATGGVRTPFGAESLPESPMSSFIQQKVRNQMASSNVPFAEKTVLVRIISDCDRSFLVPDVIRKHFAMAALGSNERTAPPLKVNYRSKAIALFQKIDGLDVCIFCMYVHEYDGKDEFDSAERNAQPQPKRVYIAYLDSVEHFRPRTCRTLVFQEILVSYLATARERGYENAHIWACPPSRGNSFVFWNHPASQRTPNKDRLVAWYHSALSRALDCGVVTDVKSLFESDFEQQLKDLRSSEGPTRSIICPPLLDGDFWIEESVRIHRTNMLRQMKPKLGEGDASLTAVTNDGEGCCPAMQVAAMLRDRIIAHPSAVPFRKPVNAAALKLKDYHQVITKPMDLGSVYSGCILGEYKNLGDLVSDVDLVVNNARRYNPKGHIVHTKAIEVRDLFYQELSKLVNSWKGASGASSDRDSWKSFSSVSMSLDEGFRVSDEDIETSRSPDGNPRSPTSFQSWEGDQKRINLLKGGAAAVEQRMVGDDKWLLEKNPLKAKSDSVKKDCRRRKNATEPDDEPVPKRRRQSWLSIEVGNSVRRMRASFFTCSLKPRVELTEDEADRVKTYSAYVENLECLEEPLPRRTKIADVRHALMEFSQFRNLEFDTVRHSKYSTAVILYHLHRAGEPGIVPLCSGCGDAGFQEVRWHKIGKVVERRSVCCSRAQPKPTYHPEELCSSCFEKHKHKENFIPVQVSLI